MKIINQELFDKIDERNSRNPFGEEAGDLAKKWAGLMEQRIENGEKVKELALETLKEAGIDKVPNYTYYRVVEMLSKTWIYGKELRTWANGRTDIKPEYVDFITRVAKLPKDIIESYQDRIHSKREAKKEAARWDYHI